MKCRRCGAATPYNFCSKECGRANNAEMALGNYASPEVMRLHRGTTIIDLEAIVEDCSIRCESCGDATNNAEPFCNGPICFKRGD